MGRILRSQTLTRLRNVTRHNRPVTLDSDDHNVVYAGVKKELNLRIQLNLLQERNVFLNQLKVTGIGTKEIEATASDAIHGAASRSRTYTTRRTPLHVKWVRDILKVRISLNLSEIRATTRTLNAVAAGNNRLFTSASERREIRKIMDEEVRYASAVHCERLEKKHAWLKRLYMRKATPLESDNVNRNITEPGGNIAQVMLNSIKTSNEELQELYRHDRRFKPGDDFVVYGDINLTEHEKSFLNLPPKFRMYGKLNEESIETEIEKSHLKARYQMMQHADTEQQEGDEVVAASERHETSTQSDGSSDSSSTQGMNIESVQVQDTQSTAFSFANRRVTDFKTNTRLLAPKPASESDEVRMHSRKQKIMEALKEYKERTNSPRSRTNRIPMTNLTYSEYKGLMSLKKRVANREIVINPTDKSGKYAVTTPALYRVAAMEHTLKDTVVTEETVSKTENEANNISMQLVRVLKLGQYYEQTSRVKSALKSTDNPPPPVYFYFKDHKNVRDGETCPPTRPICGANEGPLMRLSELLSDVLERVIDHDNMTEMLCDSTEDMLSRIESANEAMCQHGMNHEREESTQEWFSRDLVVMSEDVEALYPSIDLDDTMSAIHEVMNRTNLEFDITWKEVSKFIAVSQGYSVDDDLQEFIPDRDTQVGRRRTTAFLSQPNDDKWVWKNHREPTEVEKRRLFTTMLKIVVTFMMKNHVYTFDGKYYRQVKGGPIGLRLTGVLAKLVMIEFSRRWKQVTDKLGMQTLVDAIYVDDHNIALWEVKPGVRYDGEHQCVYIDRDAIREDIEISGELRTAKFVTSITNTVMPRSIKMKHDVAGNHDEKWLPVLDLELRVENNIIYSRFYKKPMASSKVIHRRSAMSNKVKRSVLIQEGLRRMYNCTPNLPLAMRANVLQEFAASMMLSGHSESFREYVLTAVMRKYEKDLQAYNEGAKPLYRKKSDRTDNSVQTKSKTAWLEKVGHNNLMVIPNTPGSKLLKHIKQKLQNIDEPEGIKTLFREDGGIAGKQLLCRSDPFPRRNCSDTMCMMCSSGNDTLAKCRVSNVNYEIECKCCNKVYIGTTSRNCRVRGKEHASNGTSTINKHAAFCHPTDRGNQYEMRIVRHFNDPLTRQVHEAVKISRAVKERRGILNEKKEFNVLRLVQLSAEYDA